MICSDVLSLFLDVITFQGALTINNLGIFDQHLLDVNTIAWLQLALAIEKVVGLVL